MPSNARQIETVRGDFLDESLYMDGGASGLPALSRGVVLTGLSRAFDLAEGRQPGHAQRVAYISTSIAEEMRLAHRKVEDVFFASLLHDVGMAATNAVDRERVARLNVMVAEHGHGRELSREAWSEVSDALRAHARAGAKIARKLGLSEGVSRAIEHHHDIWVVSEGGLEPDDRRSAVAASIVAAADRMESLIDHEGSPLLVRRRGRDILFDMAGHEIEPRIAETMVRVASRDSFWLGLYDNDLSASLVDIDSMGQMDADELIDFLSVISDVVDARSGRERGRGSRIAELAGRIARNGGLAGPRIELIHAAALLQDIGTLGVPVQYLSKPDILTVEEMASMQMHPAHARDILCEIPGFGTAAWWVGCHHERVDGKGYPAMLEGNEVPIEAQIIGMAEAFVALTSMRPYRPALGPDDALEVIRGMCGARFDSSLMPCLESALSEEATRV